MEIITYILSGTLEHKDSMGNGSVIRPGDFQRMSAGTGVLHSEFNPSNDETVHLLQIWIFPSRRGLTPSYEQKHFSEADRKNRLRVVASPDGREGSVTIHQDALLFASILESGKTLGYKLGRNRHSWIQVARGAVIVNEEKLSAGDGVAISDEKDILAESVGDSEFLLFDLA